MALPFKKQHTCYLADSMKFPERMAALHKVKSLTQQALADKVGVHLTQIQRYESGAVQPTVVFIFEVTV